MNPVIKAYVTEHRKKGRNAKEESNHFQQL